MDDFMDILSFFAFDLEAVTEYVAAMEPKPAGASGR